MAIAGEVDLSDTLGARGAAVVIAMPTGLPLSGITTWAARLANALVERAGRRVVILAHRHAEVEGEPAALGIRREVEVIRLRGGPVIHTCRGEYSAFLPTYRDTVEKLFKETGEPVVGIPTLAGDCFGIFACLAQSMGDRLRMVTWLHNDIAYDYRTATHFEPMTARFVGVTRWIVGELARHVATRTRDVSHVAYCVPHAEQRVRREALQGRPLRLVYTGRIEHEQKRIGALLVMSDALHRLGVAHEMLLAGDGAAAKEIDQRCAGTKGRVRRVVDEHMGGPLALEAVLPLYAWADMFVLGSRYEGACVSMLEAMGQGAVPIVPGDISGLVEAIDPGNGGEASQAHRAADETEAGEALARSVQRVMEMDLVARGERCRAIVAEKNSVEVHLRSALEVIDGAATSDVRWWPGDRACAPGESASAAGIAGQSASMTVPADAGARARKALGALEGRRVAVWGAGRHTIAIATALAETKARVVGVIDDDPKRQGQRLWGLPIVATSEAATLGAQDVLISSWMHEDAMWRRRSGLEALGLRVHRMYS